LDFLSKNKIFPKEPPLEQSLGREEAEELMESADWAVQHACDNCKSHLNFY